MNILLTLFILFFIETNVYAFHLPCFINLRSVDAVTSYPQYGGPDILHYRNFMLFQQRDLLDAPIAQSELTSTPINLPTKLEDAISFAGVALMSANVFSIAVSGGTNQYSLLLCAVLALLTCIAHYSICTKYPLDEFAPRLGSAKSIFEFSSWYLFGYSWLLYRISTSNFPSNLSILDIPMAIFITSILLYSAIFSSISQNKDNGLSRDVKLLLDGNFALTILAAVFLPFIWTIAIRGQDWWERIQQLHFHQEALMCISVLVAIIGNNVGLLMYTRKDELLKSFDGIFNFKSLSSTELVVIVGLVVNFILLIVPEVTFHLLYSEGISELGFYWE
mmetsp:Transcript_8232/g.12280  ORF Transcript_8232/g.12280 Transcript_8232/m.12280 type:complete len:334 (-) Transcript_8232:22-1023(-)